MSGECDICGTWGCVESNHDPNPPKNAAYWKRKAKGLEADRDEWRDRYQRLKIRIQAALGNGIDEEAWKPSERWDVAACRNITENRK